MGLKVHLQWFDKKTEEFIGEEYSPDLGDDDAIIESTLAPKENVINDGWFDLVDSWIFTLQPHFKQQIESSKYDYQVAFDYRDKW
ncbi:colicin E3-like toxin immunity protein [Brenneria corticis]|uniref:Cloacin n=1 Tax=Brenneria corticis TaxID=2173106 RepID=A0A2U1TM86_9GAMM|nr:colicin E3-like toxin immunity protein [Brenneria sp. CFCC 11842]PWC10540.1 cloacin [Brenneria sp. CFCC 11842]